MARIKDLVQAKKLNGIADLKDLTDRNRGLHLVIEVRSGFNPDAVLAELYRLTPMEETFGINNVALVDGQPRVLGLRELLEIYVAHRLDVVRRRTEYRRRKRLERLHLVDGLLVALLNIDEVIAVIRSSDDASSARERLMAVFELSEIQAQYILDTPLRLADPLRPAGAGAGAGHAAFGDRFADRDPGVRRPAARGGQRRAGRDGQEVRHPAAHGAAGGGHRGGSRGGSARGDRRPVRGADVGHRADGPGGGACFCRTGRAATGRRPDPRAARCAGRGGAHHGPGHDRGGDLGRAADQGERAGDPGAAARGGRGVAGGRHAGDRVRRAFAGRDGGGPVRGRRRPGRGCRAGHRGGRGQAGAAGLPAEPGRVRADRAAAGRPGGGRGAAVRGVFRAGVHHLRRAAAAVPGLVGTAAGPGRGRDGRRAAVGRRVFWRGRGVVRRGGRGRGFRCPRLRGRRRGPTPPRWW